MDETQVQDWKWAAVFIEVALRAIRRVHYEHQMWGVGRQWQMNRLKARRLNMGQGVELADERMVCAAITQEFINSPSLTGLWIEESRNGQRQEEERYFTINREMEYTNKTKKVDIFIQKYVKKNGTDLKPVRNPSFIEAKRARRWVPDILDGTANREGLQHSAIQKDIEKLRYEMMNRKPEDSINCHVLVWGLYTEKSKEDHPLKFFENFDDSVKMHQLRWLPIEWTCPSLQDIKDCKVEIPKVDAALWVALAQVYALEA